MDFDFSWFEKWKLLIDQTRVENCVWLLDFNLNYSCYSSLENLDSIYSYLRHRLSCQGSHVKRNSFLKYGPFPYYNIHDHFVLLYFHSSPSTSRHHGKWFIKIMKIFADKSSQVYQIPKSTWTHGSYVDP